MNDIYVQRTSDRKWLVTRITRLACGENTWNQETLGCVYQGNDGKWCAYVPRWLESGFEYHKMPGAKWRSTREEAICELLDRPERTC